MPIVVQAVASEGLIRRVEAMRAAAGPRSPLLTKFRSDLKAAVELDHEQYQLLAGKDDRGRERAPLMPSTLARRVGTGPSLIPRGLASRFATHAKIDWQRQYQSASILVKRFVDIVDAKGRSFAQYHLTGTPRMAKRSVGGISPRGFAWAIELQRELVARIAKAR